VELNSQNGNALNGLGWASFNSGNGNEAEQAWKKLLEMEPEHPAALNGMGQLYLSRGDLAEARMYLRRAADRAPAAWWGLTKVYFLEGNLPRRSSGRRRSGIREMKGPGRKLSRCWMRPRRRSCRRH